MKALFSILSLLIVLAVVGLLAKKQLSAVSSTPVSVPGNTDVAMPTTTPGATPQQQSQQIQQQVKQSVEAALQQARPLPDEK
jgi:multidrug efflux pump subunit AcrB